jgi:uncharacterized sporulation protein YeaH/YhbH (DUF444 family)
MGLRDDLDRYRKVGEERRDDLADFIQYGDLGGSRQDEIRIPIKIVELPAFEYDQRDVGGVGQGDAEEGDAVGRPQEGEGEEGEPGEGEGEHGYYEMDPEEFAEELEEEFELHLEPKGKAVVEEKEGDMTDVVRSGPRSTLDLERMFKRGLRRKLASQFDPEYVREALRVEGMGTEEVFGWARDERINVSKRWLEETYDGMDEDEKTRWSSLEEMEENVNRRTPAELVRADSRVPFRSEDERYRFPEVVEEHESKVVVVNIRDVSGSMGKEKRELVERTFTPLDWYLQGKYEEAEFVYIAHDIDAWEVDRRDFFGIQSGGGTKISSAYELAAEILDERYPWSDWNRYVFAAGDGENSSNDSKERVVPLIEETEANLHAYVETQPSGGSINATHSQELRDAFGKDEVVVTQVNARDEVMDAVYSVLRTAAEPEVET